MTAQSPLDPGAALAPVAPAAIVRVLVRAVFAVQTRILVLVTSRLDDSPSTVIVFSSCSDA